MSTANVNPMNHSNATMSSLSSWIRQNWKISSKVEIYSESTNEWVVGDIISITGDTLSNNECLNIQYTVNNNTYSMQIQRNNDKIRPLTKAIDLYKYIYTTIMCDKNNKSLLITVNDLTKIIKDHSTYSTAINALLNKLPFNKQICKNIISQIINEHKDIKLIDDINENEDIKQETQSIHIINEPQSQPSNSEINKLQLENDSLHQSIKLLKSRQQSSTKYYRTKAFSKINWFHISNCVKHEISQKLSITIQAIVDKNKINHDDTSQNAVKIVLTKLQTMRFQPEKIEYLRNVIQRAQLFDPNYSYYSNTEYESLPSTGLIADIDDIFNVHRAFIFGNYHFREYSSYEFKNTINKNKYLGTNVISGFKKYFQNDIKPQFDFTPDYIIDDDLVDTFSCFFGISHYIHNIKKEMMPKQDTNYDSNNIKILGHHGIVDMDGKCTIIKTDDGYQIIANLGLVSVRGNFNLIKGKWYYEVKLIKDICFKIGFAENGFIPNAYAQNGKGVGDDIYSWSYDGLKKKKCNSNATDYGIKWNVGDIIGCCIDMNNGIIKYYVNGNDLGSAFDGIKFNNGGVYPTVSIANTSGKKPSFLFVFDEKHLKYKPDGYSAINVTKYFKEEYAEINDKIFELRAVVISNSVTSVFDKDIKFKYSIKSVDEYLWDNSINDYIRCPIKCDLFSELKKIDVLKMSKVLIIIDRRQSYG
eukprot:36657_1